MFNRHRIALTLFGSLAFGSLLVGGWRTFEPRMIPDACLARLTALDNPRAERAGRSVRFDGTLLLRPESVYVEGILDVGNETFRIDRQIDWTTSWLRPSRRTVDTIRAYYGDTLPAAVAARIPLIGETRVELRYVEIDRRLFAVFANDMFVTYCRRLPAVEFDIPANSPSRAHN